MNYSEIKDMDGKLILFERESVISLEQDFEDNRKYFVRVTLRRGLIFATEKSYHYMKKEIKGDFDIDRLIERKFGKKQKP
ncbi:MAG: hypothetical protein AB8B74_06455 [Crocinitomicaceae bacterium]